MPWNKLFIKAVVKKKDNLYLAIITWSWYNLINYDEYELFNSLVEANDWILKHRTNGSLTYE